MNHIGQVRGGILQKKGTDLKKKKRSTKQKMRSKSLGPLKPKEGKKPKS
jgi:hypothetical protein